MRRRDWLKGGLATAICGTTALTGERTVAAPRPLDLADPATLLQTYVRLRGSAATGTVYRPYEADLFMVRDGEIGLPLCGVVGVQKSRWMRSDEGGVAVYAHRDFDVGVYVDFTTRAPLDTWRNPLTGRQVPAQPYRSGPSGTTYRVGAASNDIYSNPGEGRWTTLGPLISHTSVRTAELRNPLSPDLYPLASSGKTIRVSMSTTYMARRADLEDVSVASPPSTMVWTDLTAWNPWMEMGMLPGQILWRLVGEKARGADDIAPDLVAQVEAVVPGYIREDAVWDGPNISGYQEYMRTHPVPH